MIDCSITKCVVSSQEQFFCSLIWGFKYIIIPVIILIILYLMITRVIGYHSCCICNKKIVNKDRRAVCFLPEGNIRRVVYFCSEDCIRKSMKGGKKKK